MTRLAQALAVLVLVSLGGGIASAQGGGGRISDVSSGLVSFAISDEDLAAASGCPGCTYVYPDPGPTIVFEVLRQNPNVVYVLDAFHAGWAPTSTLQLEARYTVTNRSETTVFLVTPWLPLSEAPTEVFTQADVQRETWVRVTVEYRLALTGDEEAGETATRMTHRVRQTGSSVSHDVRVSLPTVLALRLVGTTLSGTSFAVAFDYGDDVGAYLAAITASTPLGVTASDLARAEISTNHPRGYTVTLVIDEVFAPAGSPDVRGRVLLYGAPADGRSFTSSGPTDGFVPLFEATDYTLRVTGDEVPGSYLFNVRLEAVRNP